MMHQAIKAFDPDDEDVQRAIRDAGEHVAQLAAARAKKPARAEHDRQAHAVHIRNLEGIVQMIADRVGWTGNELEQVTRAEWNAFARRTGRPKLPEPRPAEETNGITEEQRRAGLAVLLVQDAIRETERLIGVHQARLVKLQLDLARKREAARRLAQGSIDQ